VRQATKLADWLLQVVLPPDVIRQLIVDFLTDRTIQLIDEGFREKGGTYWVVANLFGLRNPHSPRTFCRMKEAANARLAELTIFGSSQSPEDMAEEFIFRKFAGLNSAAVA